MTSLRNTGSLIFLMLRFRSSISRARDVFLAPTHTFLFFPLLQSSVWRCTALNQSKIRINTTISTYPCVGVWNSVTPAGARPGASPDFAADIAYLLGVSGAVSGATQRPRTPLLASNPSASKRLAGDGAIPAFAGTHPAAARHPANKSCAPTVMAGAIPAFAGTHPAAARPRVHHKPSLSWPARSPPSRGPVQPLRVRICSYCHGRRDRPSSRCASAQRVNLFSVLDARLRGHDNYRSFATPKAR